MQFFILMLAALALLIGVSLFLDRYCTFWEWMEGQGLREADFLRMQQAGYIAPPSSKWKLAPYTVEDWERDTCVGAFPDRLSRDCARDRMRIA